MSLTAPRSHRRRQRQRRDRPAVSDNLTRPAVYFSIVHTIRYAYSRPVFLEPHELRLQPVNCGAQTLRNFDLKVTPSPAGMSHGLDPEGNRAASLWFNEKCDELTIVARSQVETRRGNPFDYLARPHECALPMSYDESTASLLGPARQRANATSRDDAVGRFAQQLRQAAGDSLTPFLDRLNQSINADFECIRREQGDPWPAAETLASKHGSCRDFAVLFIDACRAVGAAARFVSGYQEGDKEQDQRDLHAWAEVYVPGGGWRGYDPTLGLAVADRHVVVAASAMPQYAAPTRGTFRGADATATMHTHIELESATRPEQLHEFASGQRQQ